MLWEVKVFLIALLIYVMTVLLIKASKFQIWLNRKINMIKTVSNIPGPRFWDSVNALLLDKTLDPVVMFKICMGFISYGTIYKIWLNTTPHVVLQGPREIEPIVRDSTHMTKSSSYGLLNDWMGQGLLTANDEKWRVHRKILTPAFHFNILQEFIPIFTKNAIRLTKRLSNESAITETNGFNIFNHTSLCSLDIICESAMGIEINAQENEKSPYVTAVNRMTDLVVRRYFTPWLRSDILFYFSSTRREIYKILDYLNKFTDNVIDERRKYLIAKYNAEKLKNNEDGKRRRLAFLDLLLETQDEEARRYLSQKDIRDQVSTFMFEGHDTIATGLSWTLFMIGAYPDIQERIVKELEEVFGDSGRAPDMNDLAKLNYLDRCIKESLRLYPSVPFFEREIQEDVKLGEYTIPAGATVSVAPFIIHRQPEFWPDPEKFDPDRFLPENSQGRHFYSYIPFSAGPRNCIGQRFAILEEKAVLSSVLRHYRVEAAHPVEHAELQFSIVLRPRNGLRIRLYERKDLPNLRVASDI